MKFWTTNRTEEKEYTHLKGVELYIHSSCSEGIVIRTLKSQSHTVNANIKVSHLAGVRS